MFLVLDNASYHSRKSDVFEWSKSKLTKQRIHNILVSREYQGSIDCNDGGGNKRKFTVYDACQPSTTADGKGGPDHESLQVWFREWVTKQPEYPRTHLQWIFEDRHKRLGHMKHCAIYTVPYASETQPIEKMWAWIKRFVADTSFARRSVDECYIMLVAAFNLLIRFALDKFKPDIEGWIRHAENATIEMIKELPDYCTIKGNDITTYEQNKEFVIDFSVDEDEVFESLLSDDTTEHIDNEHVPSPIDILTDPSLDDNDPNDFDSSFAITPDMLSSSSSSSSSNSSTPRYHYIPCACIHLPINLIADQLMS
jgi:hypothetical protein